MLNPRAFLCLALLSMTSAANAQPVYLCEECRRPHHHYTDFGNFAFNAVFGANPWIGPAAGQAEYTQPLNISNLAGQVVPVYFEVPSSLIPQATDSIKIVIEKPNGVLVRYEVLVSRVGQDLPVGSGSPNSGPGVFGGGGGGRGGAHGPPPGSTVSPAVPRPSVCGTTAVDGRNRRRTCI